jgi:hypothetical protein
LPVACSFGICFTGKGLPTIEGGILGSGAGDSGAQSVQSRAYQNSAQKAKTQVDTPFRRSAAEIGFSVIQTSLTGSTRCFGASGTEKRLKNRSATADYRISTQDGENASVDAIATGGLRHDGPYGDGCCGSRRS